MNKKAIIIVLDSVGIGELPDAANYGDKGADTLGHIINTCHPNLPHMMELGLANIDGAGFSGAVDAPKGCYGKLREVSAGKDTTTGPLEIAGIQLAHAFPTFPNGFPQDFIEKFEQAVGAARWQQARLRHGDSRRAGRGAPQDRQTDCLHLGGQRIPDRGERSDCAAGRAVSRLRLRARC